MNLHQELFVLLLWAKPSVLFRKEYVYLTAYAFVRGLGLGHLRKCLASLLGILDWVPFASMPFKMCGLCFYRFNVYRHV